MEKTLIIIKPDAVQRELANQIKAVFEKEGFEIVAYLKGILPFDVTRILYEAHAAKPFFVSLLQYMTASPSVVLVLQGPEDTIERVIALCGCTDPLLAEPHTIRGIWGLTKEYNSIHRSDSAESAQKEMALFFPTLIAPAAPIFSLLDTV